MQKRVFTTKRGFEFDLQSKALREHFIDANSLPNDVFLIFLRTLVLNQVVGSMILIRKMNFTKQILTDKNVKSQAG